MISNEQFREYIANKLGITLFADFGEFESAYRVHNSVVMPLCGIFRMNPMTVTPLQDLFIASATATVEIAAEEKDVAYVRALVDGLASSANGETVSMEDADHKTFMTTFSYSTAYVGLERTAPNNTGKLIPVSMTVYIAIIQNGVSSCDVKLTLDGNPVYFTEFVASHQKIADSYVTGSGITSAAITQSVRSFDFVAPLLSSTIGAAFRSSIFGDGGNEAHCFTVEIDGVTYPYIAVFGNTSGTARAPQNVGCNISLMEGDPATLTFGSGWSSQTVNGNAVTLSAPSTGQRNIVFWGDGTSEVWDTTTGTPTALSHSYASAGTYIVHVYTEFEVVAVRSAPQPDQTYRFYADEGNMTATLFTSDAGAGGFWRRNCTVDWGDGTVDEYNTMTNGTDNLPRGLMHTYEESGEYTVRVFVIDDPIWVSTER